MDGELTGRAYEGTGPRPRLTYLQGSAERRLEVPRRFLDEHYPNNEALRKGLAKGGLKPKHLDALRAALDPAVAADDAQAAAYQGAGAASERLKASMPAAEEAFDEVFRRGTAAGKQDPALREALDVGRKERNRTKRLAQMRQYLNGAETNEAALVEYGLEPGHLPGARAALATAEKDAAAFERLTKEAEASTKERDRLLGPVDRKMRDVQERGKAGMPDEPDLLELLGLPPG